MSAKSKTKRDKKKSSGKRLKNRPRKYLNMPIGYRANTARNRRAKGINGKLAAAKNCPLCASPKVFLNGLFLPNRVNSCGNCGHNWKDEKVS